MKLSIVIPAYNEEQRLKPMLEAYAGHFVPRYGRDVELLVVVNGSTDRTEEVARAFGDSCPQARPIVERRRIGKGGAILLGFEHAAGDLVGFVDADNSTPPEAFQDLVDHLGDADAIIANRWLKESVVQPRQPWRRRVASRIFNALVRGFFGLRISDTQCGAKLFRRSALQAIRRHIGETRWAFDVDLLFHLRRAGFRTVERPTTWRDAGGSKLHLTRTSMEMFMAICRLRLLYSPLRWVVYAYDRTLGRLIKLRV